MTILPKKKNVSKEKSDGENSDHAPHSPSPGEVNNLQLGRGRSGATSPNNWHSMPNEQSFEEYDNHPSSSTSHNKRRHRSSPHRTVRKHRADSHREREPSHATARPTPHRERTLPNASASMASPVTPDAPSPIDEMLGVGHLPGGTASSPTRDTKLDTIEETGNNSEDEYNPMIPTEFNFPGCEKARNLDELDSYFGKALKEKRGLIIKQMVPDGACLFRAVADQVYGDQEMHPCVRKCCVEYMAKNADFFNHYVTEDFNTYLKRKLVASSHGNHIEIQAMCEMYSRPIEVFQYSLDPINIFHGTYATDNEPIRISYHRNTHYNSVCDPYKATIGVGLGLPGHKPGSADKNLMQQAQKLSEDSHIEKTMMEDKLRETDWEVTQETIEEQVARESYLQWLKDNEKRAQSQSSSSTRCGSASATCSSTATASDYPTWDSGASGGGVSTISVAPNCSPPAARSPAPLSPHEAAPNPASILAQAQQLPSIQTNTMPLSTECNLLSTGMSPEQVDMATDLPLSLDSPLHLAGHSPTSHHNTSTTNTGAIATTSSAATNITASSDSSFPQTMQHHPSDMVGSGGSAILSDGGAVSGGATAGSSDGVSFNETASIMNDLPLQCYGLSDWDDSDIMAQVMAQSQQEYYDQLRKSSNARSSSSWSPSSTDCYASTSSHYPGNYSTSNDDS